MPPGSCRAGCEIRGPPRRVVAFRASGKLKERVGNALRGAAEGA